MNQHKDKTKKIIEVDLFYNTFGFVSSLFLKLYQASLKKLNWN